MAQSNQFLDQRPINGCSLFDDLTILAALFLGMVGAAAPCQISANVGAITYFGQRYAHQKLSGSEVGLYLLVKIIVFSIFGLLFRTRLGSQNDQKRKKMVQAISKGFWPYPFGLGKV